MKIMIDVSGELNSEKAYEEFVERLTHAAHHLAVLCDLTSVTAEYEEYYDSLADIKPVEG